MLIGKYSLKIKHTMILKAVFSVDKFIHLVGGIYLCVY